MAKIQMEKAHAMAVDEVKSTLDGMMDKFQGMGIDLNWEGDTLYLSGKGVKGKVDVQLARVAVDLDLGLPASLMKGKIEQKIRDGLEKHLA